jgi:glycerol-3-phosphate dehydrogenase
MAEDAVDALSPYLSVKGCKTTRLKVHGATSWRPEGPLATHFYRRYGSDTTQLLALIDAHPSLGEIAIDNQTYYFAEFVFGLQEEMATSLCDLLTRRTRAHLHDARATRHAAPRIVQTIAPFAGWDSDRCQRELADYEALVTQEFAAAGLEL